MKERSSERRHRFQRVANPDPDPDIQILVQQRMRDTVALSAQYWRSIAGAEVI